MKRVDKNTIAKMHSERKYEVCLEVRHTDQSLIFLFVYSSDFLTREAGYVQLLMYLNLMMVSLLLFISQLKVGFFGLQ